MKLIKILEKYFLQQFVFIIPICIVLYFLIFNNISILEMILYSILIAFALTFELNSKLKKLLNNDFTKKNHYQINLKSDITKKKLLNILKKSKKWDIDIIEEYEGNILIISNMSLFSYGNVLKIEIENHNDIHNIKISSISDFKPVYEKSKSQLEIDKISALILNYNQEKLGKKITL